MMCVFDSMGKENISKFSSFFRLDAIVILSNFLSVKSISLQWNRTNLPETRRGKKCKEVFLCDVNGHKWSVWSWITALSIIGEYLKPKSLKSQVSKAESHRSLKNKKKKNEFFQWWKRWCALNTTKSGDQFSFFFDVQCKICSIMWKIFVQK